MAPSMGELSSLSVTLPFRVPKETPEGIQVILHSFRIGVVGGVEVSSSAFSLIEVAPSKHWEISSPLPVRLVQRGVFVLASRIEKVIVVPAGTKKFA